ncbi:hypothetical protein TanjilG_19820 [Lupinus angustifolius]|uniref:Uncharacterized protein n=1 Tax=Lupinus angustifolius TaxID=3871 RepID=A0A1J7HTU8_LUPAN|nr:hypothetical protein TanjilG_19820 [Lupinus angustifolius]
MSDSPQHLQWGTSINNNHHSDNHHSDNHHSIVVAPPPQQQPPLQQPPRVPRRRGTAWSEDEHKLFLFGLRRYGKGDWRSISRFAVVTRTPCQVASHAQKYFIRQSGEIKKRKSIHDVTLNEADYIQLSRSVPRHDLDPLPHNHNHIHNHNLDLTSNRSSHFSIHHNPNPQNLLAPSQYQDTTTMGGGIINI